MVATRRCGSEVMSGLGPSGDGLLSPAYDYVVVLTCPPVTPSISRDVSSDVVLVDYGARYMCRIDTLAYNNRHARE